MAVLMSCATGNWLTAGTWALVNSTSYSNSESANSALTASYVTSSTFTPGAITIDGIAVKVASRAASPSGTISVALDQAGSTVAGSEITLNVSDLNAAGTTTLEGGWVLFKFAAPVTLAAATAYGVKAKTSSISQVNLFSAATTNWSRALRTTTTQAPVAGDDTIVAGEHTGAGTGNDITITMNETATTDYGSNTTSTVTPALAICKRGTLKWSDGSAANPMLRLSGHLLVYSGGTLNIGTTGTPIPRDSVAVLEFDCAADGDFGLVARNGSTIAMQGLSRTSGKNACNCKLAADASASGGAPSTSTLTVDTDTGWLSGDQIAIASTSRTASDCETGTLTGNAGSSSFTVNNMTAGAAGNTVPPTSNRGLLAAHSGTSPTQAEIILLTRNVKVRSVSATAMSFVYFDGTATSATNSVDIDWVQFYYLGENATGKRGVEIGYGTSFAGSISISYSSIHDCEDFGLYLGASIAATTVSWNNFWNIATVTGPACQIAGATSATNYTIDSNILIRTGSGNGWTLSDVGGTFTNNTVVAANIHGISLAELSAALGIFSGLALHACASSGINIQLNGNSGILASTTAWRNSANGINCAGAPMGLIVDNPISFGNAQNIALTAGGELTIKSPVLNGDSSFSSQAGVSISLGTIGTVTIDNGDFSTVSGIKTAHSTADINFTGGPVSSKVVLRNCKFGAATEIGSQANLTDAGFIASEKHDQTAGNHKTWMKNGTIQTDATTYNTGPPSMLMTPTSATLKLESAPLYQGLKVAVNNGNAVTVSAYVRKSASYNGNQPRLIQRANPALGQNSNVVLATYASGTGSWNQISGTTSTPTDDGAWEIVVDCDGTAGAINIDDFAVT